jgi:glycosyltransferase involved in cell wall biosynthesis
VPEDDVKATVAACQNLLANKTLLRQLGQKGRRETVLKYNEHAWGNKILDFYQNVFASLRVEKVRR